MASLCGTSISVELAGNTNRCLPVNSTVSLMPFTGNVGACYQGRLSKITSLKLAKNEFDKSL